MHPVPSLPGPIEGLYFILADLQSAMAWASNHPEVRLCVTTDHIEAPEAIEIYPSGSAKARWLLWRDHVGRLRVDDWARAEFDLPYSSVKTALAFIASTLDEKPSEQKRNAHQ